jgi:hypothetical protein
MALVRDSVCQGKQRDASCARWSKVIKHVAERLSTHGWNWVVQTVSKSLGVTKA